MGKWLLRLLIFIVVLAAAVFFGLPPLLGTNWAREKIRSSMEKSTGRKVEIGSVSFSWANGLAVRDVKMDQKEGQPTNLPEDRAAGAVMNYTSGTTGRPKGVRRKLSPLDPDTTATLTSTSTPISVGAKALSHYTKNVAHVPIAGWLFKGSVHLLGGCQFTWAEVLAVLCIFNILYTKI